MPYRANYKQEKPMQNDDHKPGKKPLRQAKASNQRNSAKNDDWVERLVCGLEAGISEDVTISAVIKTESGEQKLNYLPRHKETWLALTQLQFLGTISEDIAMPGKFQNLMKLWVDGYKYLGLKILPAEIGKLHNLQTLDFRYNQITTLPAEIGQLHNLQELYLDNNQIFTLPAEITQLQ